MANDQEVKDVAETAAVAAAEASWPQTRAILRVILIALAVAGVLWVLYALTSVILLVVLSIFFAYFIAPLVEFMRRPVRIGGRERVMPRAMAIAVVYLLIFGGLILIISLILPRLGDQIAQFAKQVPGYLTSARQRAQSLNNFYQRNQIPAAVGEAINSLLTRIIEAIGGYASVGAPVVVGWLGYVPWLVLIPILAFFLLKDADSFRRSALQMLPRGRWRWRGDEFFQDVNSTLAAYIRAQLIASVLIGSICTIGFLIIGAPYWLALGVIAGVLEFIPLVGPLTVAVIAAGITSFYSIGGAFVVLLFLGVLRIVEDYVIYPRIIGQGIHLHPLAVILAILSGAELAGVAGVFLAIPVIAIATVSYRHWLEHRGSEGLVADLLKPPDPATIPSTTAAGLDDGQPSTQMAINQHAPQHEHPTNETTPGEMARVRPDLTTGELKMPNLD